MITREQYKRWFKDSNWEGFSWSVLDIDGKIVQFTVVGGPRIDVNNGTCWWNIKSSASENMIQVTEQTLDTRFTEMLADQFFELRSEIPEAGEYDERGLYNLESKTLWVRHGGLTLYYSYGTLVAFRRDNELVISRNEWRTQTGKHLNWINPDKKLRIPHSEVMRKLRDQA